MTSTGDKDLHDSTPADALPLGKLYRSVAHEMPSAELDARVLAAGRLDEKRRRLRRWTIPLSLAATIVLSVGIVWQLPEPVPKVPEEKTPAAPTSTIEARESMKLQRTAPRVEPAPPMRADAERPAAAAGLAKKRTAGTAGMLMEDKMTVTGNKANIVSVDAGGTRGAYQFSVGIRSPDTGCDQYADWWEVVSEEGRLLYRRVLLHSHVNEQPFSRSGGPVPIEPNTPVWIRAHMNTTGYGGVAFKGTVEKGFAPAPLAADFAASLATQSPLPDGCAF